MEELTAVDQELVHRLVQVYAEGARDADPDQVGSIFAEDACMWGWLGDDYVSAPIAAFLDVVRASRDDPDRSADYAFRIVQITMRLRMAVVVFEETGYLGQSFTNAFTFLKRDGRWLAVSKTFTAPAR